MSDPVRDLKRELLAAAERQQEDAVHAWDDGAVDGWAIPSQGRHRRRIVVLAAAALFVAVASASAFGTVRDLFFGERRTRRRQPLPGRPMGGASPS